MRQEIEACSFSPCSSICLVCTYNNLIKLKIRFLKYIYLFTQQFHFQENIVWNIYIYIQRFNFNVVYLRLCIITMKEN